MTNADEKVQKDDYLDKGPMPSYDSPKPICIKCESDTWVVAAGRDSKWKWYCTNCVTEFE